MCVCWGWGACKALLAIPYSKWNVVFRIHRWGTRKCGMVTLWVDMQYVPNVHMNTFSALENCNLIRDVENVQCILCKALLDLVHK